MEWSEFSFILKPSQIAGIGVFTTHDLPKGARVFSGNFTPRKMKIKEIPSDFLKYCIFLNDEECLCPNRFDHIEIGWYVNHSDHPNIEKRGDLVFTLREIKAGEEILMDYNQLNEPEHLKDRFYRSN